MHLAGNMIGLWGFGLVVEGKIGWKKFLGVFLGIGVSQCAIEQVMAMGSDGGSFGASAIVFGLLAMSLVWAPENEMSCLWWFFRPFFVEVSIATYSALVLSLQVATAMLSGSSLGSEVLHLMGAAIGFVLATVMVKRGLVDCEGWDLYSVIAGRHRESRFTRALRAS